LVRWPYLQSKRANAGAAFHRIPHTQTAKLQVVKRCHPIRGDSGGLLSGNGAWRGLRTRFKYVLKFPTVLCREPIAEQFSRIRENRHQETAKNCCGERARSNSKVIGVYPLGEPKEVYSADFHKSASSSSSASSSC